jgi:hypothetical protein
MTFLSIKAMGCSVVLALVLHTPAEAAKARKSKKIVAAPGVAATSPAQRGAHLFPTGPVMYGNEYLGTDPDPFIRSQLLRDVGVRFGDD